MCVADAHGHASLDIFYTACNAVFHDLPGQMVLLRSKPRSLMGRPWEITLRRSVMRSVLRSFVQSTLQICTEDREWEDEGETVHDPWLGTELGNGN